MSPNSSSLLEIIVDKNGADLLNINTAVSANWLFLSNGWKNNDDRTIVYLQRKGISQFYNVERNASIAQKGNDLRSF